MKRRPCVILNPRSFRASAGNLSARIRELTSKLGAEVVEATDPTTVAWAIDRAVASGGGPLVVVAGDGTVQAIADYVARLDEPARHPSLLILSGGRTNLIAADLGGGGRVLARLASHLNRVTSGADVRVQERHTLVVEQAPAPARHGFFLAGAHLDSIIRACHAYRASGRSRLHTGHLSNPYTVMKLGLARLIGRKLLPARPDLNIDAGELGRLHGPTRLLLASTLSHATGLVSPFANRGAGILQLTAVGGDAKRVLSRLPRMLLGRYTADMHPRDGFLSGRCEQIEVTGLARYTLDGEKFECDPTRPVTIRVGAPVRFVLP
jgi:hypothetical protein